MTALARRLLAASILAIVLATLGFAWLAHPVCMPLTDEDVASANQSQPLDQRTDRQLHGPIFQRRAGRWYQCKSWISRQLFF